MACILIVGKFSHNEDKRRKHSDMVTAAICHSSAVHAKYIVSYRTDTQRERERERERDACEE